jgi:hypothetical protein
MLCRYITEGESNDESIIFDPDRYVNVGIIKNTFLLVVGEY